MATYRAMVLHRSGEPLRLGRRPPRGPDNRMAVIGFSSLFPGVSVGSERESPCLYQDPFQKSKNHMRTALKCTITH